MREKLGSLQPRDITLMTFQKFFKARREKKNSSKHEKSAAKRRRENQLECLKQSQTPATSINSRVLYQRESRDSNATLDFIQAFL